MKRLSNAEGRVGHVALGPAADDRLRRGNEHHHAGNWHHIASTFDVSTITFYYDGALVSSYPALYARQLYDVKIGFGNNVDPNGEFWNGAMDDACVFDRALSADEIAMLMRGEWKAVNVLNPASDLSIDAGAKLDLGGTDQTVATLTLKGWLCAKPGNSILRFFANVTMSQCHNVVLTDETSTTTKRRTPSHLAHSRRRLERATGRRRTARRAK